MAAVITYDEKDGWGRAALWRGKVLTDLFVDSLDDPDKTGAFYRGKVGRVKEGQKTAWLEVGDGQRVYVESKNPLQSGSLVTCRIKSDLRGGKAPQGVIVKGEADGALGLITPPPRPWQRAIEALAAGEKASLVFQGQALWTSFEGDSFPQIKANLSEGGKPVHPDLDDQIDVLSSPMTALAGGASLIIEPTQAFVAVDVNGGEGGNALSINLLAVRELARQIRLRNLGGIILVDCLKMDSRADGSKLVNAFARAAAGDPAKPYAAGITKLGILEIVRPHAGPSFFSACLKGRG